MKNWLNTHVITALLFPLALFMGKGAMAETTLERVERSGEIRIGYANEAPFAFTRADGKVTGESPEIARQVFEKIGVTKIHAVLTEWGGLIPGLLAGRFDVIAAGMYVTPERAEQVLFTDPHYQIGGTLLVARGNPHQLNSYASFLANDELKLAIMAGTAQYTHARAAGIPDRQIMQVPNTISQLQAVRSKRADAAVGTQLTMKVLARKGGKSVMVIDDFVDDPAHTGYGALAFRLEDQDLRDRVNTVMKSWIGSEAHLATIAAFGFDRSNLTHKTVEEIAHPAP